MQPFIVYRYKYNLITRENELELAVPVEMMMLHSPFLNVSSSLQGPSYSQKVFAQAALREQGVNLSLSDAQTADLILAGNMSHCFLYD